MVKELPGTNHLTWLFSKIYQEGVTLLSGFSTKLPTLTINDRMTLYLNEVTLELMHLKGHTPNSLMAYIPEQKILFSGDNVCELGLPSFKEACLFLWFETLKRIMEMDIRFIVPGHGKICTKAEVKVFYIQIEELADRVMKAIKKGAPKSEIVDKIRFEDRIHTGTPSYKGYSEDFIEELQRKSIGQIYDNLVESNA